MSFSGDFHVPLRCHQEKRHSFQPLKAMGCESLHSEELPRVLFKLHKHGSNPGCPHLHVPEQVLCLPHGECWLAGWGWSHPQWPTMSAGPGQLPTNRTTWSGHTRHCMQHGAFPLLQYFCLFPSVLSLTF